MSTEKLNLPVGRIVWGNPANSQVKRNFTTKQPVLKEGKQIDEWACGVAIPKDQFMAQVWPFMQQEAMKVYPNGVPRDFSWKMTDGDSIDDKGQPFNKREGYAGHYILKISTEAFAPSIYKFENGAYRQVAANEIKCGDYVVVNVQIKAHTNNSGGLYINPNGFELVGYGPYIASSGVANPEDMFKNQQHALPPGASAVPVSNNAAAGASMPGMPPQGYGTMPAPTATYPQQNYAPAAIPVQQQLPPPAHDFVQNAGVQQFPQQFPAQPAAYPQANALPVAGGIAPVATMYPTNGMPGMPPAR